MLAHSCSIMFVELGVLGSAQKGLIVSLKNNQVLVVGWLQTGQTRSVRPPDPPICPPSFTRFSAPGRGPDRTTQTRCLRPGSQRNSATRDPHRKSGGRGGDSYTVLCRVPSQRLEPATQPALRGTPSSQVLVPCPSSAHGPAPLRPPRPAHTSASSRLSHSRIPTCCFQCNRNQ